MCLPIESLMYGHGEPEVWRLASSENHPALKCVNYQAIMLVLQPAVFSWTSTTSILSLILNSALRRLAKELSLEKRYYATLSI